MYHYQHPLIHTAYDSYKYPRRGSPHPALYRPTTCTSYHHYSPHSILTLCGGSHVNVNAKYLCPSSSTFSSPLSGDSENIPQHNNPSCTYHQFDITSIFAFVFSFTPGSRPSAIPPIPPITHYYNWCRLRAYFIVHYHYLLSFVRSFVRSHSDYLRHLLCTILSTIFVCSDPVSLRAPMRMTMT